MDDIGVDNTSDGSQYEFDSISAMCEFLTEKELDLAWIRDKVAVDKAIVKGISKKQLMKIISEKILELRIQAAGESDEEMADPVDIELGIEASGSQGHSTNTRKTRHEEDDIQVIPPGGLRLPSNLIIGCGNLGRTPTKKSRPDDDSNETYQKDISSFLQANESDNVNIISLKTRYNRILEKWYSENEQEFLNCIQRGKTLTEVIKSAREDGYNYVTFKDFTLNVNLDTTRIATGDLTRARFMAIMHAFLHDKFTANPTGFKAAVSPLVMKIIFEPNNPLYDQQYLLGTGFQYQGPYFTHNKPDRQLFYAGCAVLDYLSTKSEKSPRYNQCVNLTTFPKYCQSMEFTKGDVLIAGLRNMKDTGMTAIQSKEDQRLFYDLISRIKIDLALGGAQNRVAAAWAKLLEQAKKA